VAWAALACAPLQGHASRSADEKKIAAYVDAHNDEAIALLAKVVDIESPTDDPEGVRAVGAVFRSELAALGLEVQWLEMPAEMQRAGHLLATTHGKKGKRLLLLGHIDTVLRGEKFRRDGTKAYGTGVSDMKSGVVLLLYALKAMHAARALRDARIK
jgi:glutamate carboxypeptidase